MASLDLALVLAASLGVLVIFWRFYIDRLRIRTGFDLRAGARQSERPELIGALSVVKTPSSAQFSQQLSPMDGEYVPDVRLSLVHAQWLQSARIFGEDVAYSRFFPVRLLLSDGFIPSRMQSELEHKLLLLLETAGFTCVGTLPEEFGSVLKRFWMRTTALLTRREVQDRLAAVERALELKHIGAPRAGATRDLAEAASSLIQAVQDLDDVRIQVGSLLLVKTAGSVRVATLSERAGDGA